MVEKLSITVTDEQARRIRERVERGEFASASEVVRAALSAEEDAYERRIASIRTRVQAALDDPRRYGNDEVDDHISELARRARGATDKRSKG